MVAVAGVLVGLVLLVPGVLATLRPHPVARVLVRLDAIGARSGPAIEAAEWYVAHVRTSGIAVLVLGGFVTLFALLG
jgi:hypothetical protein